jgi:hypothetical protein
MTNELPPHTIADPAGIEYQHAFVSALPIFSLAIGVIALAFAIHFGNRQARVAALVVIGLSAALVWPVCYYLGWHDVTMVWQQEENRWVSRETRPTEEFAYLFFVVAALSALTIFAELTTFRAGVNLAVATLLPGTLAVALGGYMLISTCRPLDRHSQGRRVSQDSRHTSVAREIVSRDGLIIFDNSATKK